MSQRPETPSDLVNAFQRLTMSIISSAEPMSAQVGYAVIKVKTPDSFQEEQTKLRAFVSQCETYFRFNQASFMTNENKVVFASTYLRGSAYDWFEPTLTDFLKNALDD
jgi:hypothetical protein